MYNIQKTGYGVRLTFSETIKQDEMAKWVADSEKIIRTLPAKFGVFVDIGVHMDGLIHISQLADRYVKDPGEVVKIRQQLTVTILAVDKDRGRISLSLKTGKLPLKTH